MNLIEKTKKIKNKIPCFEKAEYDKSSCSGCGLLSKNFFSKEICWNCVYRFKVNCCTFGYNMNNFQKKNRFEKLCHILDISSIPPIKNPTEGDRCFKALKSVLIQNSSALISNKFNKFDFIWSCSKCNIQINNPYNFFYKYHEKICTNKTKHLWCLVKQ
jgi:hypothetical protein